MARSSFNRWEKSSQETAAASLSHFVNLFNKLSVETNQVLCCPQTYSCYSTSPLLAEDSPNVTKKVFCPTAAFTSYLFSFNFFFKCRQSKCHKKKNFPSAAFASPEKKFEKNSQWSKSHTCSWLFSFAEKLNWFVWKQLYEVFAWACIDYSNFMHVEFVWKQSFKVHAWTNQILLSRILQASHIANLNFRQKLLCVYKTSTFPLWDLVARAHIGHCVLQVQQVQLNYKWESLFNKLDWVTAHIVHFNMYSMQKTCCFNEIDMLHLLLLHWVSHQETSPASLEQFGKTSSAALKIIITLCYWNQTFSMCTFHYLWMLFWCRLCMLPKYQWA